MTAGATTAGAMTAGARVAVVTGGGRGIGAAICQRLAADGFAVGVNYSQSRPEAEAVVKAITADGGRAVALQADVSDSDEAAGLISAAQDLLGTPTVLVNNAGLNISGSVRKLSPAQWDRVIGVNLSGAFYCTHAALPGMYEAGWGRVVLFGSPAGGRGLMPAMASYAAAKAGLVAFAGSMAKEVARRGITVNTIVPGFVETDMTRAEGEQAMAAMHSKWPAIPPERVAGVVSFLVSDEGAYVSGEEIGVWLGGPVPF
jgi:3-oxoacyl-[acyl-carrier protein] reductase